MRILLSLLLFLCFSFRLNAQDDHLKPVEGIFSIPGYEFDYYSAVRKILFKGLPDYPDVRFVVIPSFTSELVLDIEFDKEKEQCYLYYHRANPSIWYNIGKKKITVDSTKKHINYSSFILIKTLFNYAISKAKYQQDSLTSVGVDGQTYFFSVSSIPDKTATIWSPAEGSKMAKLVKIANHLVDLARSESDEIEFDADYRKEIVELTNSLK